MLRSWFRHCATSRKVVDLRPEELIFFSIYLILSAAQGPGVYSAFNIDVYQKRKNRICDRARPVLSANLTAICQPIV
jgi:hypothetical protein